MLELVVWLLVVVPVVSQVERVEVVVESSPSHRRHHHPSPVESRRRSVVASAGLVVSVRLDPLLC